MTREDEVEATVRELMEMILGRPIAVGEDVCQENESSWDSLRHVELLVSVEGALNVRFDEGELPALTSFQQLVATVKWHRAT